MAKCHPPVNDVGSLILNHSYPSYHHHHYRRWNSFSLRKLIAATISCGGGYSKSKSHNDPKPQIKKTDSKLKSIDGFTRPESGKLLDLLNISSSSCDSMTREKAEEEDVEEVRRKEERLEELRMAVRLLQTENNMEERENGAKFVRRFAKEDGDARSTLAMLGAIPPLIAMLDDDDDDGDDSLIQALYALLNLGIGNDL